MRAIHLLSLPLALGLSACGGGGTTNNPPEVNQNPPVNQISSLDAISFEDAKVGDAYLLSNPDSPFDGIRVEIGEAVADAATTVIVSDDSGFFSKELMSNPAVAFQLFSELDEDNDISEELSELGDGSRGIYVYDTFNEQGSSRSSEVIFLVSKDGFDSVKASFYDYENTIGGGTGIRASRDEVGAALILPTGSFDYTGTAVVVDGSGNFFPGEVAASMNFSQEQGSVSASNLPGFDENENPIDGLAGFSADFTIDIETGTYTASDAIISTNGTNSEAALVGALSADGLGTAGSLITHDGTSLAVYAATANE